MRGGSLDGTYDKWSEVNQMMLRNKIDILTLQETHLTKKNQDRLNEVYGKRLHIISTIDKTATNRM